MSIVDNKITNSGLANKGNVGMADTPNLTTAQMQAKLDEIPVEVIIPHFNSLIDSLIDTAITGSITFSCNWPASAANVTVKSLPITLNAI